MKILQINSVYAKGSTGILTASLHHTLKRDGFESVVLYGRGTTASEPDVIRICSDTYAKCNTLRARLTGLAFGGCRISTSRAIRLIQREKPDVVHLQCINEHFVNIYRLVGFLKSSGIPTVLTLHAEFMYTGGCGHSFACDRYRHGCGGCPQKGHGCKSLVFDRTAEGFRLMKNAFDGFKNLAVVSVSPWLKSRAEAAPILAGKHHSVILNGVDTDVFHRRDGEKLKAENGWTGKKIIFQATAKFSDLPGHAKGGEFLIRLARRMRDLPVIFAVAGKTDLREPLPENVVTLGEVTDRDTLAALYSAADLTLLTSKKETYSLVAAESLCCATPVLGFEAGAPEQIALKAYSRFVPFGDEDALLKNAGEMLGLKSTLDPAEFEKHAADTYSVQRMIGDYENLYKDCVKKRYANL